MKRLRQMFGGLRVRIAMLLLSSLVVVGFDFYALLLSLTRQWLLQELTTRSRSYAGQIAKRVATPMLLEDRVTLHEELARAARESDVVGIVVFDAQNRPIAHELPRRDLWRGPLGPRAGAAPGESPSANAWRDPERRVLEVRSPISRVTHAGDFPFDEADELGGLPGAAPSDGERLGSVVVAVSTERLDETVSRTSRMALTMLVAAMALGFAVLALFIPVITRPLREASELARAVAAGELSRRLPVRSDDELGRLAESMNIMAGALSEARSVVQAESEALRTAAGAVVAVARGARAASDVRGVFGVVASQLRRLTGCEGVALASATEDDPTLRVTQLEPETTWGGLWSGVPVDRCAAAAVEADRPERRTLTAEDPLPEGGLYADGFRSRLIVPLSVEGMPRAVLLLIARRDSAFPPSEVEVVAGLASHLSSALHAARLRERLERAIGELEATRNQLVRSERLRVAGEMATGVAHDFNNVLGAILGRVQLLRRGASRGELASEELTRALEIIERAARDGGDTVRRLRQFGQGEDNAPSEAVDLDVALRDAAEFTRTRWENEAHAHGQRIRVELESEPGAWVHGRVSELREVFVNLILNAVDALPAGGTIRLRSRLAGDRRVAVVEDNGVGMSEELRRRVFDPFVTTKGDSGTGLGLSVAYGIVQRHGGAIAIESEPGVGTQVRVTLPRAEDPAAPPPAVEAPVIEPTAALDVMVVDDQPAVRELLVDVLDSLGHRPRAYASGEAALADFAPGRFDLVLTDLGMPGMTGWQLARRVRAADPGVTLAFITGWGEEVDHAAARETGADAVVAKPFDVEDIERLARLARERRIDREAA